MYRAHLYAQTSSLPPLGSIKDRILVEKYYRDRADEREKYEILFITLAKLHAGKLDQQAITTYTKLLDIVSGLKWLARDSGVQKSKQQADLELLEKVKTLDTRVLWQQTTTTK